MKTVFIHSPEGNTANSVFGSREEMHSLPTEFSSKCVTEKRANNHQQTTS